MSFGSIFSGVVGVITGIGNIAGGGTAAPNTGRINEIFNAALSEGPNGRSYQELRCWAGINDAAVQRWGLDAYYRDKAASGYTTGCTSNAANTAYAQQKITELELRWKAAGILATGGATAVGISDAVAPGTTYRTFVAPYMPWVYVGVAVVAIVLVYKYVRRR